MTRALAVAVAVAGAGPTVRRLESRTGVSGSEPDRWLVVTVNRLRRNGAAGTLARVTRRAVGGASGCMTSPVSVSDLASRSARRTRCRGSSPNTGREAVGLATRRAGGEGRL